MASSVSFNCSGLKEMRMYFQELQKPPVKMIAKLEKELQTAFLGTQAATHVITGSLKFSGRTESDFNGQTWQGSITYGGPSTGPNNPVDYAIFEEARGGDHDFMAPARAAEPRMEAIMNDWVGEFK